MKVALMIFLLPLMAKASFLEKSYRYLSPIDFVLKLSNTLPNYRFFITSLRASGHKIIEGTTRCGFEESSVSNDVNVNRRLLKLMGGNDPVTGQPGASSPTPGYMTALSLCLDSAVNDEFNYDPYLFEMGNAKIDVSPELTQEFSTRVFKRYFSNLKDSNGHDVIINQTIVFQDLSPDSQQKFLMNLVNLVFGDIDVLVSYGYFASSKDVIDEIVKAVVQPASDLKMNAIFVLKYLMLRDEFLSY